MASPEEIAQIKPGSILYEGWGYDQTQYDFCKVIVVSPSGKSLLCRMIGQHSLSYHQGGEDVAPNPGFEEGEPFRVLLKPGRNDPKRIYLVGSYPFCIQKFPDGTVKENKRFAYWSIHAEGNRYIETER